MIVETNYVYVALHPSKYGSVNNLLTVNLILHQMFVYSFLSRMSNKPRGFKQRLLVSNINNIVNNMYILGVM